MTARNRRLDRALLREHEIVAAMRREVATTRRTLGLSRRELGAAVDVSPGQIARFESGVDADIGLGRLTRLAVGVGLEVSLRLYPGGEPVRDAGHLRLEQRLRTRISAALRYRIEVPIQGARDARALDAVVDGTGCVDAFEFETRVGDIQAVERAMQLKLRDDVTIRHAFLVLSDTRHHRRLLAEHGDRLRLTFPADTREVLAAFGQGHCPGRAGIVIL